MKNGRKHSKVIPTTYYLSIFRRRSKEGRLHFVLCAIPSPLCAFYPREMPTPPLDLNVELKTSWLYSRIKTRKCNLCPVIVRHEQNMSKWPRELSSVIDTAHSSVMKRCANRKGRTKEERDTGRWGGHETRKGCRKVMVN